MSLSDVVCLSLSLFSLSHFFSPHIRYFSFIAFLTPSPIFSLFSIVLFIFRPLLFFLSIYLLIISFLLFTLSHSHSLSFHFLPSFFQSLLFIFVSIYLTLSVFTSSRFFLAITSMCGLIKVETLETLRILLLVPKPTIILWIISNTVYISSNVEIEKRINKMRWNETQWRVRGCLLSLGRPLMWAVTIMLTKAAKIEKRVFTMLIIFRRRCCRTTKIFSRENNSWEIGSAEMIRKEDDGDMRGAVWFNMKEW